MDAPREYVVERCGPLHVDLTCGASLASEAITTTTMGVGRQRGRSRYIVTSIVVGREQLDRLDAVARSERRSRSYLLRAAVEHVLALHERALALSGEAREAVAR